MTETQNKINSFEDLIVWQKASATEVLSAAILAHELEFISASEVEALRPKIADVTKMLNKLISSLETKINNS